MVIIMLGAPGTGKGTVGKLLSDALGLVHISSGEIFRSYIKKQGEIGRKIEDYISNGLLVPDELAIQIVEKRLNEPDVANGVILDGFPRTRNQAIILDYILRLQGKKVDVAVELELSDDEIVDRIVKRRTCINKDCREIYNLDFKPPKKEDVCDKCGGPLVQRIDDNEETVRKRLETYHKTSEGLITYYQRENVLYTVKLNNHSDKTTADVAVEVKKYLNQLQDKEENK